MRFDVEIPPINNSKLIYIPEGKDINSFLCPLTYYSINTKDVFIDNFVSAEEAFAVKEFSADGFEVKDGPSFKITSDKILLTHIYKFSNRLGTEVPLFYKYVIHDIITPDTIRVVDYFGLELDKSEYIVEVYDNKTYIYMNKNNNVMFVEFISNSRFTKSILDLVPVFQEVNWNNLAINGTITDFEYTIDNSVLTTIYNGKLFLSYINNTKLFKKPVGNLEDSWNVRILNSNFVVETDNKKLIYTTPEFYRQKFDGSENLKLIKQKKCIKVFPDIIKSQYSISQTMYDFVNVFVEDFYSKEVRYAFTTNTSLVDTKYTDNIFYNKLDNISTEGYIYLPVQLKENDVAYATHYTNEDYLTYTKINISSIAMGNNTYCAFYLKPNVSDTSSGVAHAIIGDFASIEESSDKIYFNKYQDYIDYITEKDCLHIALTAVSSFVDTSSVSIFDVRCQSGNILNKQEAAKIDIDTFYDELITGNIVLPTNDTALVKLNSERLIEENRLSDAFVEKIKDTLNKNLDISTKSILKIS